MIKPVTFPLYLDRIEEGIAVLLLGEGGKQELHFPVEYLPAGIQEGHWLNCLMTPDPSRDVSLKNQNQDLMADLLSASEPNSTPKPSPKSNEKAEGKPDVR